MECVELAHDRVLTTHELQRRYLETIYLIAKISLTHDQM
jgi:hypothetical protein